MREAYAAPMETHTHPKKQYRQTSLQSTFLVLACLLLTGVSGAKPLPQTTSVPAIRATAGFVGFDTTTQGSWRGVYGSDGYSVANDAQSIPSYATFAVQNQQNWTWASATADPRALQTCDGSSRLAATWYNDSSFSLNVNLTDGNVHQLALYAVDWDAQGRSETVQISDSNSGTLLDTRTITNFTNGTYLIWNLSGSVKINVITNSGPNSVVSGAFWGTAGSVKTAGAAVATFVKSDATTQGNWHGVYGGDGYSVANDSQSVPAYATLALQNQSNWTWAQSTTDPRALQTGSNTSRIAATWYNGSNFSLDVNLTDGQSHQLALYALDWDRQGRSETIQIVDANTLAALDSRTISSFTGGIYLVWNVSGNVKISITTQSGPNSVIGAVFFGGSSATPASSATGQLSVSPTIFNFGNVNLGSTNSQSFAITNTGTAPVNISQITVSGTGLSASNATLPISLSAGQSTSAVIKFAPSSLGAISGLLTITSNASNSTTTVAISGAGAGIAPAVTTQPASETVTAGNAAAFSVANTGTSPLTYQWLRNGNPISGAISSSYTTAATTSADNGAQFTVAITNSVGSVVSNTAILTVNPGTPVLNVSSASLTFGNVNVSNSSSQSVTLTNAGTANVTISNVSISGAGFNASGLSAGTVLTPGQTATLNATFTPAASGAITGSILVASNASDGTQTIALAGTGVAPVTHSVMLSWIASTSTVTGYNTYVGTVSGGPYVKLNASPVGVTEYTDGGLQTAQTRYYVVTSVNASNVESAYSNEISVVVP